MAIIARQMMLSVLKYPIKAPYPMDAQYITIHNTANNASANSEIKFMVGNNDKISYHYAIDDFEVVQAIPLNRTAWHTGDGSLGEGNRKSIGIEICYSLSGGERYKKAENLTIKFVAQLLHERGWNIDRVRTHRSWTEIGVKKGYSSYVKNCPHRILDEKRWQTFLNAINYELNLLKKINIKEHVSTPSAPMWDGMVIKEGQIGRLTILKPINLWSRDASNKLAMIRVLNVNEVYRVYDYDDKLYGGQYDLGSNCWVTNMAGYIKYETPSKSKQKEADEYYNR